MNPELHEILTAVSEGRLDPDEAARRLAGLDPDAATPTAWAAAVDDPGRRDVRRTAGVPTTMLCIHATTRRVTVTADATVATVDIDGPHDLRREGSTLVLDSSPDLSFSDPMALLQSLGGGGLTVGRGLLRSLGSDLAVRYNPEIELDVDVTAGSLVVRGGSRVRARVTGGSARIEGVDGPLDLHVVGGTAKVDMTVSGPDNRIRCESGSLSLRLRHDSDVRLRPDAQLGRIVIDGVEGGREVVVGAGAGRLELEIVVGNLQVEVEKR